MAEPRSKNPHVYDNRPYRPEQPTAFGPGECHKPAGSPEGGQFTGCDNAGGSGGFESKTHEKKAAKQAAKKIAAKATDGHRMSGSEKSRMVNGLAKHRTYVGYAVQDVMKIVEQAGFTPKVVHSSSVGWKKITW